MTSTSKPRPRATFRLPCPQRYGRLHNKCCLSSRLHADHFADQHVPGGRALQAWCMQVDLGDMDTVVGDDNRSLFMHPCRCGGRYLVADADLSVSDSEVLVQCQTCSLVIRVLYSVES